MSPLIVLDAGPVGLITNPKESEEARACRKNELGLRHMLVLGHRVMLPEISDYEVRRELLRAGRKKGLARLDALADEIGFLPINTNVMRAAAELWALARNRGFPTADDKALDADVILAAQANLAGSDGRTIILATTNVGHLSRFVDDARLWSAIS